MNKLYLFGDSHACKVASHWGKLELDNVEIIDGSIIGKLAYSFGTKCFEVLNIKNYVQEGSYVCFCFGETDCRCHVFKQISSIRDYKNVIDDIITVYIDAIHKNVSQFNNIKTFVYNVVPPTKYMETDSSHPFPFLGTDEQRKSYYKYFNQKLKEKSDEYGYIFIDVYDKYTDQDGFLNKQYSDGNVHIINPCFVKEWFNENNI
jgi:hypothetical protein